MSTVDAAVTASTHAAAGGNGVQNSQASERNWFKIAVVCTYILFLDAADLLVAQYEL